MILKGGSCFWMRLSVEIMENRCRDSVKENVSLAIVVAIVSFVLREFNNFHLPPAKACGTTKIVGGNCIRVSVFASSKYPASF